jgi:hypothetical protein
LNYTPTTFGGTKLKINYMRRYANKNILCTTQIIFPVGVGIVFTCFIRTVWFWFRQMLLSYNNFQNWIEMLILCCNRVGQSLGKQVENLKGQGADDMCGNRVYREKRLIYPMSFPWTLNTKHFLLSDDRLLNTWLTPVHELVHYFPFCFFFPTYFLRWLRNHHAGNRARGKVHGFSQWVSLCSFLVLCKRPPQL